MIGKKLGHYEVLDRLGAGGMGEVFRVRDTRLDREVAIKVIPPQFLQDAERVARFEREARVLASLNHPHIAAIHGLEEFEGHRFLVLELVAGQDLEKRLASGPIPLEETLRMARQIAEALDVAHRQGVIHRDLKPGNIAMASDGTVKVLDFGLAKALDPGAPGGSSALSHSPTVLGAATGANVILGTAAYMSPEQARGNPVDARADIWAFGCVVFECLTGAQTFSGNSVSDTLAAVLRDTLDWTALPPGTPPALRRLLRRCLERDPARRLHSMADVRIELEDADSELKGGVPPEEARAAASTASRRGWVRPVLWGAGTLAAVAAAVALTLATRTPPPARVVRFSIPVDSLETGSGAPPAISPAGDRLVYVAANRLWVRDLDELEARELPGTAGARAPFWSPDGSAVGFYANRQIWTVSIGGGSPVVICDTPEPFGPAGTADWGEDGQIVFASGDGAILEVSSAGGQARVLVEIISGEDDDFHTPSLLPGGRGVLYVPHRVIGRGAEVALYHDGKRRVLWGEVGISDVANPVYDPSGHVLFHRDRPNPGIWGLPFSLDRLEATGEPFLAVNGGDVPSVSRDGTLVYLRGAGGNHQLVWVAPSGEIVGPFLDEARHIDDAAFSPSGKRFLSLIEEVASTSVVVRDLERGTRTTLASGGSLINPFWITDTRVGLVHTDSSVVVALDMVTGGAEQVLFRASSRGALQRATVAPQVTPDGRHLVFTLQTPAGKSDAWILPLDGSGEARPLLATPAREADPQVSPDGTLLAYTSDASGRTEVYLCRILPDGTIPAGQWQVSGAGGENARWSRDGRHLYYDSESALMEVEVSRGAEIALGRPRSLFSPSAVGVELAHGYTLDPTSDRFLAVRPGGAGTPRTEIVVVQNWFEEFRDRKPTH